MLQLSIWDSFYYNYFKINNIKLNSFQKIIEYFFLIKYKILR
jgi:hypothetical protein